DRNDYNRFNAEDCRAVWPEANMLDINLSLFTALKKARNKARALGTASYTMEFSDYDPDHMNNRISIMGNPSLGEVKTMIPQPCFGRQRELYYRQCFRVLNASEKLFRLRL
ncbi:MAG: hypothetical protein IIT56_13285, partial [Bacteroidales bacterium]|nr:hypothetical protein [Bacteroidales bacterium]